MAKSIMSIILFLIALCTAISFVSADVLNCDVNTYTQYGMGANDKTTWLCYLNGTNTTMNCISYVKDNVSGVLQTNPTYHKKSNAIISLSNDIDDRTSFLTENNLLTVFFTKDNIIFDGRNYTYGVQCSDGTNIYKFESETIPEYASINEPTTRLFWLNTNLTGIFIGLFMLIFVIIFIGILIHQIKGGR